MANERRYPGWWQAYERVLDSVRRDRQAWVAPARDVAQWWLAREQLHVRAAPAAPGCLRWSCRAHQAMTGLTLQGWVPEGRTVAVTGVRAHVRSDEAGDVWVQLGPLSEGQSFVVTVS